MSSTAVLGFIKDITARNLKAVQDRLKQAPGAQTANQRFVDPKQEGLTYALLHKAVEVCSCEAASVLMAAAADVNAADSKGRTPLHWVAASSDGKAVAVAELLLQQPGINIHALSSSKATPLHEAAAQGNVPMVQLLLKHGAQPLNASPGFTTLHAACMGSCSSPKAAVPAAPAQTCRPEGGPLLQDTCCPAMQPAQPQQPQDTAQQQQGKTQQPVPAAAPASNSKPGQLRAPTATTAAATAAAALKASAAGKAAQASSQHSKPAISTTHGRLAPAATGRVAHPKPAASSKAIVQAARTGVSLAAASKLRDKAAGATTGPSGATSAAADAAAVSAAPRAPAASAQQGVSQELVGTLLAAAPQLLQEKDCEGFTPLMRLVQRGLRGEVEVLLAAGDCSMHAQACTTGDTALHLACSSAKPDLQLVAALVAAGADPLQPRSSDGSSPLVLAAKAGGQTGLAMAKALLAPGGSTRVTLLRPHAQQQQQQQPQRQVKSVLWCSLHGPSDTQGSSCSSGSSDNGQRAPNTADETAAGIAAAAVLANLGATSGAAAAAAAAVAATPAAMSAQPAAAAQQELLLLLLDRQPQLPQQLAVSLLQQGLAGRLADRLTAKVVSSIQDINSLAAGSSGLVTAIAALPDLSFKGLMGAKMYRTAVAWLSKSSGTAAADDVDAAGNTLLHRAVAGDEDLPDYVTALLEAGVPLDATNQDHDTTLHLAARQGHLEACRALVAAGADVLRRNGKNRIPSTQLKLSEPVKAYLQQAEEDFRAAKEEQRHALWDGKMLATQTQSALGIRVT